MEITRYTCNLPSAGYEKPNSAPKICGVNLIPSQYLRMISLVFPLVFSHVYSSFGVGLKPGTLRDNRKLSQAYKPLMRDHTWISVLISVTARYRCQQQRQDYEADGISHSGHGPPRFNLSSAVYHMPRNVANDTSYGPVSY